MHHSHAPSAVPRRLVRASPHLLLCLGLGALCFTSYSALRGGALLTPQTPQQQQQTHLSRRTPTPVAPPPTAAAAPSSQRFLGFEPLTCLSPNSVLSQQDLDKLYLPHSPQKEFLQQHGLTESAMRADGRKSTPQRYCIQHGSVRFIPEALSGEAARGNPQGGGAHPTTLSGCGLRGFLEGVAGGRGVWSGADAAAGFSYAVEGCRMAGALTRDAIVAALRGRRVVFTGDSIVRQMYLRLIETIRNDRPSAEPSFEFIEHYYHTDSYYALNRTADSLLLVKGVPQRGTAVADPLVELLFVWDPFPNKYSKAPFTSLAPTDIVAGHMYWWKGKEPLSHIDDYMRHVGEFMRGGGGGGVRYFYMTTPWSAKGTFGGVDDDKRIPRNEYVVRKVKALNHPRVNLLDFASFAGLKHFPKTGDGLHYQCIFRPGYPKAIKMKESKLKDGGCTDPINQNWAHVLVAALSAPLA